jgi:asparagine synthase (glutamine-hydrolysing)
MRRLVGTFDPSGRTDSSRLAAALAPASASIAELGPLCVAYSGAPAVSRGPLCLLDGYLDNAQELEAALGASMFSTPEDLLTACWRRWGRELLARLRGDFALLIWDRERGEGLLARDQLGVGSLFLHDTGGTLCFANEIRYLLAQLPRRPSPDSVGLAHWVAGKGRPGSGTLYAGVRRLEPGGTLQLDLHHVREQRYWTPRFQEPDAAPEAEVHEHVRHAIGLAVKRRLSPTGLTGVLMSGGLDSSTVAAVASTWAPRSVAAYCGVFPEHPAVDESGLINQLRSSLQLPGINAEVRAGGLLASALESQKVWDAPLVGWGDFWTLPLLREAASAGANIVLGGDGGDELFGVRPYLVSDCVRAGHLRSGLSLLRRLPGAGRGPSPGEVLRVAGNLAFVGALPYGLHKWLRRLFTAQQYPNWLRPKTVGDLVESDDSLVWKRLDGPRWWARAVHVLTRGVEELGVFAELRHTAMLAGLEARHPLFDLDLVELVLRQPPLSTFDPHVDRPVLRGSTAGLLPDSVRLQGSKARFDSLIIDSLVGSDGAAARAVLTNPNAELRGLVDLDAVRRAVLEGDRAESPHPFQSTQYVWRLLTAECWLKAQDDPDGEVLPAGVQASPARVSFQSVSAQRRSSAARPQPGIP